MKTMSSTLKLSYRRFVRAVEDQNSYFEEMAQKVRSWASGWFGEKLTMESGLGEDILLPIHAEKVPEYMDRGYWVTRDEARRPYLTLRPTEFTITMTKDIDRILLVADLLEACGDNFAVIQFVDNVLTEVAGV
jgi:hypothetical protein